jgi:hypothetical protein
MAKKKAVTVPSKLTEAEQEPAESPCAAGIESLPALWPSNQQIAFETESQISA